MEMLTREESSEAFTLQVSHPERPEYQAQRSTPQNSSNNDVEVDRC